MRTEKEKLIEFTFFIMKEFGMDKHAGELEIESWLKYPISGIRQAANDMVEATAHLAGDELRRLDSKLEKAGLPSLSRMRNKSYKKLIQVISRNSIKNEDEWRLLKFLIETETLSEEEVAKVQRLLDSFEFPDT